MLTIRRFRFILLLMCSTTPNINHFAEASKDNMLPAHPMLL